MDVPGVSPDNIRLWERKLAPPLVTLLSADAGPEAQYVALRCAALVVQRRPQVLAADVRVFFCRYDDPGYVKAEKLAALVSLASERTAEQVLLELKEYASEVDVDFARRSVRSVGKVALAVEPAAERSVEVLLGLLRPGGGGGGGSAEGGQDGASGPRAPAYVVQEVAVALRDVLRRYPGRFEAAVAPLFEEAALEAAVDEPEAKAAVVWILGEHSERLEGGDALLEQLLESFLEEDPSVQLQLLSATVKVFLRRPSERAQRMIQLVLSAATAESDDPDLRDRAYIYWRLLSTDPEAAKRVALASKPAIADDCAREMLDPPLLEALVRELGCLSSVLRRPADSFVSRQRLAVQRASDLQAVAREFVTVGEQVAAAAAAPGSGAAAVGDLLGGSEGGEEEVVVGAAGGGGGGGGGGGAAAAPAAAAAAPGGALDDLFGGGGGGGGVAVPASPPAQAQADLDDLLGSFSPPRPAAAAAAAAGVAAATAGAAGAGAGAAAALASDEFGGLMGPSSSATAASSKPPVPAPLDEDAFADLSGVGGGGGGGGLSSSGGGAAPPPFLSSLLSEDGAAVPGPDYLSTWRELPQELTRRLDRAAVRDVDAAKQRLSAQRLYVLAHRPVPAVPGQEALYVAGKLAVGGALLLLELRYKPGELGVDAAFKSSRQDLAGAAFDAVATALA
jgi:AP-1 complex subunit beta-1